MNGKYLNVVCVENVDVKYAIFQGLKDVPVPILKC